MPYIKHGFKYVTHTHTHETEVERFTSQMPVTAEGGTGRRLSHVGRRKLSRGPPPLCLRTCVSKKLKSQSGARISTGTLLRNAGVLTARLAASLKCVTVTIYLS